MKKKIREMVVFDETPILHVPSAESTRWSQTVFPLLYISPNQAEENLRDFQVFPLCFLLGH